MEKLEQHYQDKPFEILTIDVQEPKEAVEEFIEKEGYSLKVLLDQDGLISSRYNVRSHPMKFLIDEEGYVVGLALGYRDWSSGEMKALVDRLIDPVCTTC